MRRLIWVVVLGQMLILPASAKELKLALEEISINALTDAVQKKQITCEEVADFYLDRIQKYNFSTKYGPLNAINQINPNIFEEAKRIDQLIEGKGKPGKLACVPILVKDNIDSYDMETSGGSLKLAGLKPLSDSFLVAKLRSEGALILGKASMDELASGFEGISSRHGRTGNSYDPELNSGGSSSGSSVGISSNFSVAALGSDNSGSLRIPAVFNGLYTIRPSQGLISQNGVMPFGSLDGRVGPIARNIEDLAVMLDVIAKEDKNNPTTQNIQRPKSYQESLNKEGIKGKKIGIVRFVAGENQFRLTNDEINNIYKNIISKLEENGAEIFENINLNNFKTSRKYNAAGMVEDMMEYLSGRIAPFEDFINLCYNASCQKWIKSLAKRDSDDYNSVPKMMEENRVFITNLMESQKLDALLVPVLSTGIPTYDSKGINIIISTNSGLPSLAFVAGYNKKGLPVGMELVGTQFNEAGLIEIAYGIEQNIQKRQVPRMPEIEVSEVAEFDIPTLNNLILLNGKSTYNDFLKTNRKRELSLTKFREIMSNNISKLKQKE